jgi:hypothetical protein
MASQRLEADGGTQYDRLLASMADLHERGARILAEARAAQAVSQDLLPPASSPPPVKRGAAARR